MLIFNKYPPFKNILKERGFTLLETIVAVFIITMGIIGCSVLANQVLQISQFSEDRLVAINLAQEGIEVIRNIRDGNWIAGLAWNTGLPAGDWEVEYNSTSLTAYNSGSCSTYFPGEAGRCFLRDGSGFYNYSSGSLLPFKRKITITYLEFPAPGQYKQMQVDARVYWKTRGVSKSIRMTEYLYDWFTSS